MARKRKGLPIHGWVAVDKPEGMTSTQVVGKVRWLFNANKAGHGGTLDPLATGLLPVALGEATKTVPYVMDGRKVYEMTVRWGEARDTDDREGDVIAQSPVRPDEKAIAAILPRFTGLIDQVPPVYSAIKVDGQRAYDLARADQTVTLSARTVRIDAIALVDSEADYSRFRIECGKGTYMRSLARDMAQALGTVGHVHRLRRVLCGPFTETQAISLERLESLGHSARLSDGLLPVDLALESLQALLLTEAEALRLSHGQTVSLHQIATRQPLTDLAPGATVRAMSDGRLVGLARLSEDDVRPLRILHLGDPPNPIGS
ncbi:MAG: tRNA pseudouridine(55) synthase TruB [Rhodospirillaceae bacterium]